MSQKEPFNPLIQYCIFVFEDREPECRRCDEPPDGGTFYDIAPKGTKEGVVSDEVFRSLNPGE